MRDLLVTGLGVVRPSAEQPFDVSAALPGRGYRRLPPAAQYLLAAAGAALSGRNRFHDTPAHRRGVVTAENNAGAALMDAQDRTIITTGADDIGPLTAPYFVTSLFGSRLAAEYGVHGFSLTVNSPRTAGLEGLAHAARALAAGRADIVLVGATEQTLPEGEPGWADSDVGAVVLVAEPATPGVAGYGLVRVRTGSTSSLDRLWTATVADGDRPTVEAVLDDSPAGKLVERWLAGRSPELATVPAPAGCLTPLWRVAGALESGRPDRLVVTAAAEGGVSFARITRPSTEVSC